MDSFTEKILERARQRQKIISDKPIEMNKKQTVNNTTQDNCKVEEHLSTETKETLKETDNLAEEKTANIENVNSLEDDSSQNNIDVEIKVRSSENVRIEVEVKDDKTGTPELKQSSNSVFTENGKGKLQRLAKLYTDGDISSPIHRTEGTFHAEEPLSTDVKNTREKPRKGINKLAQLAENISNWEDDIKSKKTEIKDKVVPKRPWKQPAPQPPLSSPVRPSLDRGTNVASERDKWDRNMIDQLESQGFTRTNSKLIYNFKEQNKTGKKIETVLDVSKPQEKSVKQGIEENIKTVPKAPNNVANKVQIFENSPTKTVKDPALLSVGERKALFERNIGAVLLPKAPFGMSIPVQKKVVQPVTKTVVATIETPPSGIASKVAALLEAKQATISQEQIASNSKRELQKDMDVLLNRHNRNKKIEKEIREDTSDEDVDETTQMINNSQRIKVVPANNPSPTRSEKRKSTDKPKISDSPQVTAVLEDVKRIKVAQPKEGRLYPCLSDIETATETEQEQNVNSSSENSYSESYDENSSYDDRSDKMEKSSKRTSTAETSEDSLILSDMDEYMNVPLPNITGLGPTPPKQGRIIKSCNSTEPSDSFNYKNFSNNNTEFKSPMRKRSPRRSDVPILVEDGDNILPLTHTVSFYRKQQTQVNTPIRQIIRQPIIEEDKENESTDDIAGVEEKINELNAEVNKLQLIIAQTSQALNLCNSTIEFTGSTEQVEAERVLLLTSHRRQALLHEIHRLKVEKTLKSTKSGNVDKGTLTISNICLPLKREYVRALAAAGGKGHHIVCLVKCNEQVYATQVVSTVITSPKNPDTNIHIPGSIVLNDICGDFTVRFDVYCIQAQEEYLPHEVKYHINKKGGSKLTPKKGKQDNRLVIPPKESPGGPSVVKTTTFALTGYIVFSMQGINRSQWTLNNVPSMSPLEGTVEMKVTCVIDVEHRGFLTMFEDVCGFGAWHRRWFLLKGSTLSYWKYPDDEQRRTPIDSVDLKSCITKTVGPVKKEICARLHTMLLERERPAEPTDKNTLTRICKGETTIIRHLLAADTKLERIEWTNLLNKALHIYKTSTSNE